MQAHVFYNATSLIFPSHKAAISFLVCRIFRPIFQISQHFGFPFTGRGGSSGGKFRISLGLPVGAVINCADNTGAKNLYIIAVKGIKGRLNRLPASGCGDMVLATVKKGKPELRKKGKEYSFIFIFATESQIPPPCHAPVKLSYNL